MLIVKTLCSIKSFRIKKKKKLGISQKKAMEKKFSLGRK